MIMVESSPEERFSIGALAGMVGVPVETLRTWERRYGVPVPERDEGKRRQYTLTEVARLQRIVLLVRHGERVKDLAALSATRLDERLSLYGALEGSAPAPAPLRVGLVHPSGLMAFGGPTASGRLDVVARAERLEGLPEVPLDAVVAHISAIPLDLEAALDGLQARHDPSVVLVLASFLPGGVRRTLVARGVRLLEDGAHAEVLRQAVEDAVLAARLTGGSHPEPLSVAVAPTPLFRRAELEEILNGSTPVRCECPAHLAGLVLRLREFERYSAQCANDTPEQAALHAALGAGSAQAAGALEGLLARVLAADGLDPRR